MKKFKFLVSFGRIVVESTDICVEAEDQEQAEELAFEKAKNDYHSCHWKYCGDYNHNYQIDESQEI